MQCAGSKEERCCERFEVVLSAVESEARGQTFETVVEEVNSAYHVSEVTHTCQYHLAAALRPTKVDLILLDTTQLSSNFYPDLKSPQIFIGDLWILRWFV